LKKKREREWEREKQERVRERKKGKNECKAKAFFASITLLQVSKEFVLHCFSFGQISKQERAKNLFMQKWQIIFHSTKKDEEENQHGVNKHIIGGHTVSYWSELIFGLFSMINKFIDSHCFHSLHLFVSN